MKPHKPVAGWKKGKASKNSKNPQLDGNSQQKTITHFFKKSTSLNSGDTVAENSPYFQSEVPITNGLGNKPMNKGSVVSLSRDKNRVITISDSESDTEADLVISTSEGIMMEVPDRSELEPVRAASRKQTSHTVTKATDIEDYGGNSIQTENKNMQTRGSMTPETDSEEEILSGIDIDEMISSQEEIQKMKETKSGMTPESDSGEEILSGIDIDEMISSQEEDQPLKLLSPIKTPTTPTKTVDLNSRGRGSCGSGSSGSKRTPTKMATAKVNRFSPIRLLKKRSRSKTTSGTDSGSSPSPNRFREQSSSPLRRKHQPFERSSPVKKLYFGVPYYLKNFNLVLNSVVQDQYYAYLINEDDRTRVAAYNSLSFEAQCLYVRLFQRKWEWKPASTIKYPPISENLDPFFQELHSARFLKEISEDKPELESLLDLLNGEQIVELTKQMKVSSTKKTKDVCKKALLYLVKNQQTLFGSSADNMVKRALKLLGSTYQLEKEPRDFFSRLFILYSPPQYWEDEQDQTSNQLLKILMNDMGKMEYPKYTTRKHLQIYSDRNALTKFHEAWTLHCEISAQLESKNWEDVIEIANEALADLKKVLDDPDALIHDKTLPTFLRVYTAGSVLTRVCWLGVDGFQKVKQYDGANEIIKALLGQEIYLPHYRGRWHERLSINLKHLKHPNTHIQLTLENALADCFLQDSHKLTLSDRLAKVYDEIAKPPKKKSKKETEESKSATRVEGLKKIDLFKLKHELPTRTIEGEKLDNPTGGKSVFLGKQDSSGSNTASSVEYFAVDHYKQLGYTYGLHAEGSAVVSIYGLLFWDEIYNDELTDAFHTPYQAFPLDMNFEEFYQRREQLFTTKFDLLREHLSLDEALEVMHENWEKHLNKLSIVNWTVFPSIESAKSLVKAMGLDVTAAICERLSKNFRHCRAGFPDLVVWNDKDFMFVEVKGPGDSLSTKQMLWIDFLLSNGAKTEVCHVVAVSNKRIRR